MITIFVTLAFIAGISADNEKCDNLGILFYEDIGCKPNYRNNGDCPSSYTCPTRSPSKCEYKGKKYQVGESINDPSLCQDCVCKGGNITGHIICSYKNCDYKPPTNPKCSMRTKLGECCATEEYCPTKPNRPVCFYKEYQFRLWQNFIPENTCSECMCSEGFNGELKAPYCRRQQCNTELYYSRQVKDSCTPVYTDYSTYVKPALCCPYEFICDENIGTVVSLSRGSTTSPRDRCRFANKQYSKGSSIQVTYVQSATEYNATCVCNVGPFMTCLKDLDYYY